MLDNNYILIHHAIHSERKPVMVTVVVGGVVEELPIKSVGSGLRHVDFDGYKFIEQNPHKNSHYAERARKGEKITWAIPNSGVGYWVLIDDRVINQQKTSQEIPLSTPTGQGVSK